MFFLCFYMFLSSRTVVDGLLNGSEDQLKVLGQLDQYQIKLIPTIASYHIHIIVIYIYIHCGLTILPLNMTSNLDD